MLMKLHIKDINFLTFRKAKVLTGDCGVNDLYRAPTPGSKDEVMSAEKMSRRPLHCFEC